jgi:hypothetical protein
MGALFQVNDIVPFSFRIILAIPPDLRRWPKHNPARIGPGGVIGSVRARLKPSTRARTQQSKVSHEPRRRPGPRLRNRKLRIRHGGRATGHVATDSQTLRTLGAADDARSSRVEAGGLMFYGPNVPMSTRLCVGRNQVASRSSSRPSSISSST